MAPNSNTNETICELVLYLPNLFTAAAACASGPSAAAHSRSALIVISREMITQAIAGNNHAFPAKYPAGTGTVPIKMRMVATMSLSATGSRNAPNGVLHSHFLAKYPSKKSVTDAPTKIEKHHIHWLENHAATSSGIATTRNRVRMVGIVHIVDGALLEFVLTSPEPVARAVTNADLSELGDLTGDKATPDLCCILKLACSPGNQCTPDRISRIEDVRIEDVRIEDIVDETRTGRCE